MILMSGPCPRMWHCADSAPVAQGFIFWVFVYLMALLKSVSMRYFGTSLLAIIMAFSGL